MLFSDGVTIMCSNSVLFSPGPILYGKHIIVRHVVLASLYLLPLLLVEVAVTTCPWRPIMFDMVLKPDEVEWVGLRANTRER